MESNAILTGFELNLLDVTWSGGASRQYISAGTADLEITCDDGTQVNMPRVDICKWIGLSLGARVSVDITLRGCDS